MIIGSVAIDDAEAAGIVDTLRREAGIQKSATEVKFQKMFTGGGAGQRRRLLDELLAPGAPLHDRAPVYVIDKHYFVAAKLVDLLLEERFHALGYDIVSNGVGRQPALDLATEEPRATGPRRIRPAHCHCRGLLLAEEPQWRPRHRRRPLRRHPGVLRLRSPPQGPQAKKAAEVLDMLRKARPEAEEFARERPAEATPTGEHGLLDDTTDLLVTAVPTVILHASIRYGGKLQVLADDQRLLTDDKLDVLERGATAVGLVHGLINGAVTETAARTAHCGGRPAVNTGADGC